MWIYFNQGKLTICYSSNGRNVDRIDAISCGNAEQVKQTTTKLMQNKGENKIAEFWNDNNEYPLHFEGNWRETKFNLLFFDRLMRRDAPGGALPYMGYIGMCRCEGYGFQAVYSRIGYINQSVWV